MSIIGNPGNCEEKFVYLQKTFVLCIKTVQYFYFTSILYIKCIVIRLWYIDQTSDVSNVTQYLWYNDTLLLYPL